MKNSIKILGLLLAAAGFSACQDHFDNPVVEEPVATLQPNMTIFELKQKYWDDATNYIDTIGIENGIDDGQSYIIAGRVISSDEAGNIFKSLVIQDKTAALALSINSYNLYLNYRVGQEIVIDLKGMYIGKYNGLQQLGMPEFYEAGNAWEATFMAPEFFAEHIQLNGVPKPELIDTLEVNAFSDLSTNPEGLCRWQSQLVKFNNVSFQNGGTELFSEYHSSGVNQNIIDAAGSSLPVRTSGYSNFWNQTLPKGNGDVVSILSYYGTTGWQLLLNDYEGCMNFGNPTVSPGADDKPYSVDEAIALINEGRNRTGWVAGYIVGAVAPEVTSVTKNDDVEWGADVILNNTLVIGATPDTKDIANSLVISLPADSPMRQYGNLVDNPSNYKKAIKVKGSFGKYMDTYGVLGNTGSASEFWIEGVEVPDGPSTGGSGEGTEESPYTVTDVIGGATGTDVWVTAYIVGWIEGQVYSSGCHFDNAAQSKTNLLVAASPAETDPGKCIPVQLPTGDVRNALNLQDNPGNYQKKVLLKGNLEKYFGQPGLKGVTAYKIDGSGDDPNPPTPPVTGDGDGSEANPYLVGQVVGGATGTDVWVKGVIVGWIEGQVYSTGCHFDGVASSNTNLLIAADASVTDPAQCVPVQLPSGSVRDALNLRDHPGYYLKEVELKGNLEKYFGTAGLKSVTAYKIDGAGDDPNPPTPPVTGEGEGDGTLASPYNVARVLSLITAGGYPETEVYVTGTIATIEEVSTQYGNATYLLSDDGTTASTLKVFRGYYFDGAKFTSEDQIAVGDKIVLLGKMTTYNNSPQINTGSKIVTINGEGPGQGEDPNPPTPPTPIEGNAADFNTLNGGVANMNAYGTYKTANGWVADWSLVGKGGEDATNFISTDASFLFPIIDGIPARPGKLTSPTISGGLGTLSFSYGFPYNESKVAFTVNIKQGGSVVKTDTVEVNPANKGQVYTYSLAVNVSGDFVIEIVNDCLTQSTSNNKDRLAVWNLTWTN